jgi:hypothetical protein
MATELLDLLKPHYPQLVVLIVLFAVVLGPLVSYLIARRQLHGTIITTSRIKQIDDLRTNIAEFVAAYFANRALLNDWRMAKKSAERQRLRNLIIDSTNEAGKQRILLRLRLNPDDPLHARLLKLLDLSLEHTAALHAAKAPTMSAGDFARKVSEVSREIIDAEWKRASAFR